MFLATDMMLVSVKDRPLSKLRFRCTGCEGRDHDIQAFDPAILDKKPVTLWRPVVYKPKSPFDDE